MGEVSKERGNRKMLQGVVVSDAMDKTINVEVVTIGKHPLYKKTVRKSKKFMAHDENNDCNIGDTVRIMETRPFSKNKRWRLVEIVERAK
ncbi:MAG: 30S ribosomal protein S17 [bacterium]|nr:30S ribosomal protein S17 [bacterium]